MAINNSVSYQPVQYSYPPNTKGSTKTTEYMAKSNIESQINDRNQKPSYKWPVIGAISSAIAFLAVRFLK